MNSQINLKHFLIIMDKAALLAASHLISARKSKNSIKVTLKDDSSLVMNLDLECEEIIINNLGNHLPLVSEESEDSHTQISRNGDYFIIDPIDGTASCKRYLDKIGGDIGFGPLIGCVIGGSLRAAVYFDLPSHTLYSACDELGSFALSNFDLNITKLPDYEERERLYVSKFRRLEESGLLFFPGSLEEVNFVLYARGKNLVENTYRLGGFASDCTRIARDIEQIQLQCRVKAWDFSAVKIAECAGLSVILNPFGDAMPLNRWKVAETNPVLICHPNSSEILVDHIKRSVESSF